MTKQTGAQIIVNTLIKQGVDVVFGYPGGQVLDLYDELYKHADCIKHVITAHEQGAAHAADGYARATGRVGVCIATSGPGAANLVTGIATAYMDSVPLLAITGNAPTFLLGKDSFQETDIFGITIPITKHNYIVKDVDDLARVLAEAFAVAQSGRPGPVLVDVPRDVQTACCALSDAVSNTVFEEVLLALSPATPPSFQQESIKQAATLIAASERPCIYCGGGVLSAKAEQCVEEFAAHIDAVITCSMMGLTAIPSSHPRMLGMSGMHGKELALYAHDQADVMIALGARFSDRATGNRISYAAGKRIIHIDIDPAEIDKNILTDVALVGDMTTLLTLIQEELPPQKHRTWQREISDLRAKTPPQPAEHLRSQEHLTPQAIIETTRAHTGDDTVIVTDVGQHQVWVAQNYAFEKPRTLLTSGGLGTMGYGMGAAIGASVARGKERIVLFTGDGSFGMNLNELATAVSESLPLVIIIMNNGALGMLRQWQDVLYGGRYSSTKLDRQTDFVAVARAFGADGLRVEELGALDTALDAAFKATGPFVVECVIPKEEKVFPMIPSDAPIETMLLG